MRFQIRQNVFIAGEERRDMLLDEFDGFLDSFGLDLAYDLYLFVEEEALVLVKLLHHLLLFLFAEKVSSIEPFYEPMGTFRVIVVGDVGYI